MKNNIKRERKLEERSRLISLCEMIKSEIIEALDNGYSGKAKEIATGLFYVASHALADKIGGVTNFRGYLNYCRSVA